MNAAIWTERLGKHFGRTEALAEVGMQVPEGSIYALVGSNGAGKTTLIKLMMNLLRPSAGTVQVLGAGAQNLRGRALEQVGYVSENQEHPEWMTVARMFAYLRPFYPKWDRALEAYLVERFDLPLERRIRHLSRGMRMKAAMAAALAFRPALLVLDEPFSGLDPLVRDELIEALLDRAPETTILLSSHDMAEIESFSTHVGFLEQGRLLFSEELPLLAERFREVTVTLTLPMDLPRLPESWLQVEWSDTVVRFVHSAWRGGESQGEVRAMFPGARSVEAEPMALRAIFLAIARSRRSARRAEASAVARERSRA